MGIRKECLPNKSISLSLQIGVKKRTNLKAALKSKSYKKSLHLFLWKDFIFYVSLQVGLDVWICVLKS